jgi:hypothetical protein
METEQDNDRVSPEIQWRATLANGLYTLVSSWIAVALILRMQSKLGGPEWVWSLVALIPVLLEFAGYWLVTTPPPADIAPEPGPIVRFIVRGMAVVMFVLQVGDTAGELLGWWDEFAFILVVLPMMATHLAIFAIYLSSLARHIGRPRFVWQPYVALWGLALAPPDR